MPAYLNPLEPHPHVSQAQRVLQGIFQVDAIVGQLHLLGAAEEGARERERERERERGREEEGEREQRVAAEC
jgi:hypothetical protein